MESVPPPLDDVDHQRTLAAVKARMFGATAPIPRFDRFVVLSRAGEGAMGRVYVAYDPKLDRKVAVKIIRIVGDDEIDSQRRVRLEREARATAKLSHPNVITIHEVGTDEENLFVVMEYVKGPTLREWLMAPKRTWSEVVDTFVAAGQGLAAAHAAELVHRDFKPDNVLVGSDGRVRVVDFGLVHIAQQSGSLHDLRQGVTASNEHSDNDATGTGAALGTPAYMSPEQRTGESVDGRSDQYSYCVALYEALYGTRPTFAGGSAPAAPDDNPKAVPAWIHRVVTQGLQFRVSDRHRSMDALLAALGDDPRARRRPWVAGAAAVGALGGALWLGSVFGVSAGPDPCPDASTFLASTWDPSVRAQLRAGLEASGFGSASTAADRADGSLNAYAGEWVAHRNAACRETRVTGEQSEDLLTARLLCLDGRKRDLGITVQMLTHADATVAENVGRVIERLPRIERCADTAYVSATVEPPESEAVQAELPDIQAQLSRASALRAGGKYDDAARVLGPVVARADALAHAATVSAILVEYGRLLEDQGKYSEAMANFRKALYAATAAGDDDGAVDAALALIYSPGRVDSGDEDLQWSELAAALLDRLGGDQHVRRATLLGAVGQVHFSRGEHDQAIAKYEEALPLYDGLERTVGHRDRLYNFIGTARARRGDEREAVASFRRALALREERDGEDHPHVATVLHNLAATLRGLGELDEAERHLNRELAIVQGAYGDGHPRLVLARTTLAAIYLDRGDAAAAVDEFREVVAIARVAYGPKHAELGRALANYGYLSNTVGHPEEALRAFDEAWAIVQSLPGAKDVAAAVLNNTGIVYKMQGKHALALQAYERSLRLTIELVGEDHRDVAGCHLNIGNVHVLAERFEAAAASFELALSVFTRAEGDNRAAMGDALDGLAAAHRGRGDLERARRSLERALIVRTQAVGADLP